MSHVSKALGPDMPVAMAPGFEEAAQPWDVAGLHLDAQRLSAVLDLARDLGLLRSKTARISGRVSPELLAQAKARTGLQSDTDLIEFALACVALDDPFVAAFKQAEGTVDPDLKLGY